MTSDIAAAAHNTDPVQHSNNWMFAAISRMSPSSSIKSTTDLLPLSLESFLFPAREVAGGVVLVGFVDDAAADVSDPAHSRTIRTYDIGI